MRIFSTFSGIGGFEIGIQNAFNNRPDIRNGSALLPENGSDTSESPLRFVGYSEIDRYAIKVYERHFNGTPNFGDITKINAEELPDFDCLVGGFPCQAFSIAGKRRGFDDTRGTLFFDLARILREKQPRYFVFENVKGLLSHDQGNTFRTIIATIDELGYDCQWSVLNSKDFGVPQNRERVYIVGHLRGTPRPEVFPISGTDSKDIEVVGSIPESVWPGRREQLRRIHSIEGISPTIHTEQGGGVLLKMVAKRGGYNADGKTEQQLEPRSDDISNTLTAVQKDNMVLDDVRIRRLTPIECERLQGFPETEVDAIIEVCIDRQKNSVNVELKSLKSQKLVGTVARTESVNDVPSAKDNSPLNGLPISKPAQPNVHIRLEGEKVEIRNHEKSLLFASGATSQNSSVLRMPDDVFAQTIAGILRIAERITPTGKVALAQNEQSSTAQGNGNNSGKIFGYEMMLPAKDVLSDSTILKESLKSITSDRLDSKSLGSNLAILSYYVVSATSGFTDDSTKTKSISTIQLSERYGWTQYGADGPISDTQRYKMCGNAVTTNVVQAVFERILK